MKLEVSSQEDLLTIKAILLKQITQGNMMYETLVARCQRIKEILNIFTSSIQLNNMLFLKEIEVSKLNNLMKTLSDTIISTSKTEIEVIQ